MKFLMYLKMKENINMGTSEKYMFMKKLFLIIVSIITCTLVHAQDYKVEFSINNDKTIATYMIKNNTAHYLSLIKGISKNNDSMNSYCHIYYKLPNGNNSIIFIDVIPSANIVLPIEPGDSYIFQIDLTPYKKYNITKLEGCFRIIYKNAKDESVAKNIIKHIEL